MKMNSVDVVFPMLNLVIRLWIVDCMEEEVLEVPMTTIDIGLLTILAILLQNATP